MQRSNGLSSPNKLQGRALKDQVDAILREIAGEIGPIPVAPSKITSRLGTYTLLECTCVILKYVKKSRTGETWVKEVIKLKTYDRLCWLLKKKVGHRE